MSFAITATALLTTALVTSFISGTFGMAGGVILMGVLGWLLPVDQAMILHGTTQMASNGHRTMLHWRHIYWPVFSGYLFGALMCLGLFVWLAFIPDKVVLYFVLGTLPFLNFVLPKDRALDVTRRGAPTLNGLVVTALQLTAGTSGPMLDVFYVKSPLTRHQVVATKAMTQTLGHLLKLIYFGGLVRLADPSLGSLPLWIYPTAVITVFAGTLLGRHFLDRMTDDQFRV